MSQYPPPNPYDSLFIVILGGIFVLGLTMTAVGLILLAVL